jgi:hypothetical protein
LQVNRSALRAASALASWARAPLRRGANSDRNRTRRACIPDISGLNSNVRAPQQNVARLQENLQHGLNQAYEGTAVAIAMSGSALPDNKRFAITSNWGNFRSTNAMSLIAQARVSDNIVASAAFAGGFQYGGVGTRAGLTFAW